MRELPGQLPELSSFNHHLQPLRLPLLHLRLQLLPLKLRKLLPPVLLLAQQNLPALRVALRHLQQFHLLPHVLSGLLLSQ